MGTLDAVLEPFLRKEPPEPVRNVLRIGAAGLLLLETPGHAAVATAVSLAKRRGLTPFAGLVNAVLRKVATAGPSVLDDLDGPRLDTPAWLWTSWGQSARAIATAHQTEAPLDVTLKPGAAPPEGGELAADRIGALPGRHARRRHSRLRGRRRSGCRTPPPRCRRGCSPPQPGERVADLCAAPGGKTAQLAAAGAIVTAVERDPARIERLAANLKRWHLHADVIKADATAWTPPQPFDAVLLDAPCSATGTIRRHPGCCPHKAAARRANGHPGPGQTAGGRRRHAAPRRPSDLRRLLAAARGGRAAHRRGHRENGPAPRPVSAARNWPRCRKP